MDNMHGYYFLDRPYFLASIPKTLKLKINTYLYNATG